MQALTVQPPLTGNHQIGVAQHLRQSAQLGHQLNAGTKLRLEYRFGSKAQSSGRADTGVITHIITQRCSHHISKVRQRAVQLCYLQRSCALLRAKDGRGALGSAEGIIHIRSHHHLNLRQTCVQPGQVNVLQPRQRRATGRQLVTISAQKAHTQRLQQTRASIIGRTPAQPQHDAPRTGIKRRANQLAGAITAGQTHVTFGYWDQVQTAGCRHFNHCLLIRQPAPVRLHRSAKRARNRALAPLTGGHREHCIDGTFTAVGHRTAQHLCIGINPQPATSNGLRDRAGRKAFLERIRSNNQFHQSNTKLSSQTVMMPAMPCINVPMVCAL